MTVVLDRERDRDRAAARLARRRRRRATARLVADAIVERARSPFAAAAQALGERCARRASLRRTVVDTSRGLLAMRRRRARRRRARRSTGRSARTGAGTGRGGGCRTSSRSAAAIGGTVNDVVLAAITEGFRELLQSRGESVDRVRANAGAGVGARGPASAGTYNNRVSAMFAELPVGIEDPIAAAATRSASRWRS